MEQLKWNVSSGLTINMGAGSGPPKVTKYPVGLGVHLGHPISGGHKYGDLDLHVGVGQGADLFAKNITCLET
jgi:hypothetical protein